MPTSTKLGPAALLDAAGALFAERGVDAVSLGDINRASGHRNRSAATYHFGTKDLLIKALVERSIAAPDRRRAELLDALEAKDPDPPMRQVIEVTLGPMTEGLSDPDRRQQLQLLGQLVGHPRYVASTRELMTSTEGLGRCIVHLLPQVEHLDPAQLTLRFDLVTNFTTRAYGDQARLISSGDASRLPIDNEAYGSTMVSLVTAMLSA